MTGFYNLQWNIPDIKKRRRIIELKVYINGYAENGVRSE